MPHAYLQKMLHGRWMDQTTVKNLTLICFNCKVRPCDLSFLSSSQSTTNI